MLLFAGCAGERLEPETPADTTPADAVKGSLGRSTVAWSLVRRTLSRVPGQTAQVQGIETHLAAIRAARHGQPAPQLAAQERALYEQLLASEVASRPDVAAALRQVEQQLTP